MKFTMTIELHPDQTVTSTFTINDAAGIPLPATAVHQIESAMRLLGHQAVKAATRDTAEVEEPAKDGLARTGPVHPW